MSGLRDGVELVDVTDGGSCWDDPKWRGLLGLSPSRGLRARAAKAARLPALTPTAAGRTLVLVSRRPTVCKDCDPWEGKLLTTAGRPGRRRVKVKNQATGEVETVVVAGSVAQARAAGLLHPNCDHELIRYRHGVTKRPRRRKKVAR